MIFAGLHIIIVQYEQQFCVQRESAAFAPAEAARTVALPQRLSEDLIDLIGFNLEEAPLDTAQPPPPLRTAPDHSQHSLSAQDQQDIDLCLEPQSCKPPNVSPCGLPSSRLQEASQDSSAAGLEAEGEGEGFPRIESMINYLIEHSKLPEERVQQEAARRCGEEARLREVFVVLARKFRRLRKTKEEMVKYCIRKAFKFVTESPRRAGKARDLDQSMRQYFTEQDSDFSFSIPFKKNSAEKTMNGSFLRRIFSCPRFSRDYARFTDHFRQLMADDNRRKIRYLAEVISEALSQGSLSKVEKVKRLPWTSEILEETSQLALALAENKGEGIGRKRQAER